MVAETVIKINAHEIVRIKELCTLYDKDKVEMMGQEVCGGKFDNIDISIKMHTAKLEYQTYTYESPDEYPEEVWDLINENKCFNRDDTCWYGCNFYMIVKKDGKIMFQEELWESDWGRIPMGQMIERLEDIYAKVKEKI